MNRRQRRLSCVVLLLLATLCAAPSALAQSPSAASMNPEADAFYQKQDWPNASRAYREIIEREPKNGRAWFRLGTSLHALGKYTEAVVALQRAVEIGNNPFAMYNLASSYARLGEKEKALDWLDKALNAGFPQVGLLKTDAALEPLRADARFAQILALADKLAKPCLYSAEHRQFDFWVGEWDVQGAQGQKAGTNSVQRILDGCVIFENWTSASGSTGKSFNFYNSATRKWQQTWVDSGGNVLEFAGEYGDGQLRYTAETTSTSGQKTLHRLTFFNLSPERVRQLWEQSTDAGKTWSVAFDGMYIRRK